MKNVLHAFGVLASPLQVAETLEQLKVSHVVVDGTLNSQVRTLDIAARQPAWPVVVPSIAALKRYKCQKERQILFICDSLAAMSATNLRIIRPQSFGAAIQKALHYAVVHPFDSSWVLHELTPSIQDYVDTATKPSFLNDLQTEFYKLVPYDLRKEVQALVIGYLAGAESRTKLIAKLKSSYKLDKIKALVNDPKCQALRDAVAQYRKIGSEEIVAAQTGFETFEIMYVVKSSEKLKR